MYTAGADETIKISNHYTIDSRTLYFSKKKMAALENSAIDLNALSSFNRCNMNGNNGEAGGTRRAKWSFTGTSFKQRRGAYYGVFIVLVVVVFVILSIHPLPQVRRFVSDEEDRHAPYPHTHLLLYLHPRNSAEWSPWS